MWVFLDCVNALMQLPRAESDWLIFLASSRVSPVAPVFPTFSLPAKSAKFNLPSLVEPSGLFCCNVIMNKLWERELTAFIFVDETARYFSPIFNSSIISSSHVTNFIGNGRQLLHIYIIWSLIDFTCSVRSWTQTPREGDSRTFKLSFPGDSKSRIVS